MWLHEKFGAEREQPISASSLLEPSLDLAAARGANEPEDKAFVTTYRARRPGRRHHATAPTTGSSAAPSARALVTRTPLTAHVLRHTADHGGRAIAGFAVAPGLRRPQPGSVTGTYTKADIPEVARP